MGGAELQTLGFFVKDQVKKTVLTLVILIPIVSVILHIIHKGGDYFFIYMWIFMAIVTLFLMTIYPEFIAPLFDKYTPLEEGVLRSKIEALASRLSFPLKKLYVVEGSKRSAHSNAYLYGFWKNKRIVLYDTLIQDYKPSDAKEETTEEGTTEEGTTEEGTTEEGTTEEGTTEEDTKEEKDTPATPQEEKKERKKLGMSNDEVVAVLGHELGHWQLNHTSFQLLISEVNQLLVFFLFGYLYQQRELYEAFGFHDSKPILIGLLIIFQYIFAPYNELLGFLMTMFTRKMEFAADKFSAGLGYATLMQSSLIKLGKDNLSFPVNDWLYSFWHHDHPPIPERVEVLRKME